ncbi:phage terminase large subunit, partial [Candidatus Pacearchaeota archaeon]|nr:phage terminase large subunit [Candidatus Pacearchaeota archaeon]
VLFASIGSAITGFGAGIRGADKFSGMLIIDDANKPADIRSQRMREKVKLYYQETLLSRLNDSNAPILNIQQRLHVEDLSGILMSLYKFKVLKKKLLDEDGKCNLPSQYTTERLEEIQKDNYAFISQYQQEPTQLGGNVIKSAWFGKYYDWRDIKPVKLFFTGDTAQKKKEHNDYTVFCAWFVYQNNLYLLDMFRKKMESPELRATAKVFWEKWKHGLNGKYPNGFFIEDKVSGTGLIQDLKRDTAIPVFGVPAVKDKLTRVEDVLPYIECGRVILPAWDEWEWEDIIQKECEEFARDLSHKHDDIIDNICMGIRKGLCAGESSVYDNI